MLICKIRKDFKKFSLDVDFKMENETLGFLGASGSGKSLTLKCIAGLIRPDSGKIILNGRTLFDSEKKINLKPQDRRVGYLFQDYALFPNFTVEENVRTGLREDRDISDKLKEMHIYHIKDKFPKYISGGEKQRTALCRILVNKPDILLLDEPFSALDEFLKNSIEAEVLNIINRYDLKTILVSHSKDEAYRICDNIISITKGHSAKKKTTKDFFARPDSLTEAKLIGINNFTSFRETSPGKYFANNWGIEISADKLDTSSLYAIRSKDITVSKNKEFNNSYKLDKFRLVENIDSYTIIYNGDQEKYDNISISLDKEVYQDDLYFKIDPDKLIKLKEG